MKETELSELERELQEARARGSALEARREFRTTRIEQIGERHLRGEGGLAIARAITDVTDAIVLDAYREATVAAADSAPAHALVALGGYGRREMSPFSDVDLLFLFDKEKDKSAGLISGVLHPLWDVGFDIGHGSRTIAESVRMTRDDVESCTAMLDGRFLAGDGELFDRFRKRLFAGLPKKTVNRLAALRRSRKDRSGRVQVLEPNVKESAGGLREIHLLEWALKARGGPDLAKVLPRFLDAEDVETLAAGRDFLWRVRHQLHFAMGRKHDVLDHEHKTAIAAALGYDDRAVGGEERAGEPAQAGGNGDPRHRVGAADRLGEDRGLELASEHFMRDYYLHARGVFHLVELGFERVVDKPRRRSRRLLLEDGVVAVDGEISLPDGEAYFREDPLRLLRIFALAQSRNMRLGEQAQRCLLQALDLIDDDFRHSPDAKAIFSAVIRRKQRVAATMRSMHELGVLGAYLPEFGSLTCLVQYDIFHLYTVDEHTLVALENLETLSKRGEGSSLKRVHGALERRDLLVLGLLLHDVGKSRRQEHISCGVEMTTELLERLQLPEADRRFVLFLVEHHQEMVLISQRRDLDDNRMIAEFAGRFANPDWLHALYLLSYADLSAVASDAWNDWHGALLWELYRKTLEQLESGLKTLEDRQYTRQALDRHLKEIAGSWPASKVKAFQAHVEALPGRYLSAYGREEIERHLEAIDAFLAAEPKQGIAAGFVDHPSHTEVLVCARDQPHLLAKICGVLSVHDIDILRAGVNTRDDGIALDVFQVTDVDGTAQLPEWKRERVRAQLQEVIAGISDVEDLFRQYSENWLRRRRNLPVRTPVVEFENQVSEEFTVVDTDVQNGVGVLYAITSLLAEFDLSVRTAIITTVADRARDAFYVADGSGRKIVNYQVMQGIRERLLETLGAGSGPQTA